jgi:phospholipase A1
VWPVAVALALALVVNAAVGAAATDPRSDPAACVSIQDPQARLLCYDRSLIAPVASKGLVELATLPVAPTATAHSALAVRWDLDPGTESELFRPRPHAPTYLLPVHWTSDVNAVEYANGHISRGQSADSLQDVEVKFELSIKMKMAGNVFGSGGNMWAAYTQQSYWQAYNGPLSRPFLATDYEPEFIWSQPLHVRALGGTVRLLNIGALHQSNGESGTLSRSWNRLYLELGWERDDWAAYLRPWVRISEGAVDENPGIERYVGRGQLLVIWKHDEQSVTFTGRNSFSGAWHGSGQLDWAVPVVGRLKAYMQVFAGYGESIIDYNHRQTTISVGILVTDWL